MQLNCLLIVLNVAELSQTLADFYAEFYSIWTVYWMTRSLLTCLFVVFLTVCRVILLYLNCLLCMTPDSY